MSNASRKVRRAGDRPRLWVGSYDPRVDAALLEAYELGALRVVRGKVEHVTVLHDDDCPHLIVNDKGRGRCQCRPDVVPHARGAA